MFDNVVDSISKRLRSEDLEMTALWRPACPGIGAAVLWVLLASGLCSCFHNYQFINEPKSWYEARVYCREKFSDLATIDNADDMKRLIAAVGSGYEGKVWIGLHDLRWGWKWLLSDKSLYGGGEYSFRKWNISQPEKTRRYGKLCAVVQQGTWYDNECGQEFAFVCYDNNITDPSSNATLKLVLIDHKLSWRGARAYCRVNHTVLASVRNDHENSEIQQLVGDERFVWIGLYRHTWSLWSDCDKSKFQNWVDGHPRNLTESCAASVFDANHTGEWVENYCKNKLPFVCHNKKQLMIFKMTTLKSTIDLNDPTVADAFLNLIKEKIREQGVTSAFRISWRKRSDEHVFHKEEKNSEDVKEVKIDDFTCNGLR